MSQARSIQDTHRSLRARATLGESEFSVPEQMLVLETIRGGDKGLQGEDVYWARQIARLVEREGYFGTLRDRHVLEFIRYLLRGGYQDLEEKWKRYKKAYHIRPTLDFLSIL